MSKRTEPAPDARRRRGGRSDGQSEHGDDAVHGLVLPADGAAAVGAVVPVAGAGRVQARTRLLHDDAGHCGWPDGSDAVGAHMVRHIHDGI